MQDRYRQSKSSLATHGRTIHECHLQTSRQRRTMSTLKLRKQRTLNKIGMAVKCQMAGSEMTRPFLLGER
jgi:hypothetical protein